MFFTTIIQVRITNKQKELIKKIVKNKPEKYGSPSHFIRVAMLKQLKKELR